MVLKPTGMENYYLPQINGIGQEHVENWLRKNNYTNISKQSLPHNEHGFSARGTTEGVLVQVRTFLHPQRPFKLSDYEIRVLTAKALKLGLVAYAAYVIVDDNNELAGDIIWERHS